MRLARVVLLALVALIPRAACAQGPIWTLDFVSSGTASAVVRGQAVLAARVRLSGGVAPAGGLTLALTSSDPRVLSMPASVTVPAGRSEALFEIRAAAVSTPTRIDVRATAGGKTQAAIVTVTPPPGSPRMGMNPPSGGASGSAAGGAGASAGGGSPGAAAQSGPSGGGSSAAGVGGAAAAGAKSAGAGSAAGGGAASQGGAAAEKGGAAGAAAGAAGGAAAGGATAEKGGAAGAAGGAAAGGGAAQKGGAAGAAATSAALSVLVVPPNAIAGHLASFVIQARTPANTSRTTGGDAFVAMLSGPQAAAVSIKDAGDGTYVGSFVVTTTGTYTLHVLLAGVPIAGSPSAVSVK